MRINNLFAHVFFIAVFIFLSTQYGQKIGTKVTVPFGRIHALSILPDDRIFIGTDKEGLFYSPNDGLTWVKETFPHDTVGIAFLSDTGDLYVDSPFHGLYRSQKDTGKWQFIGYPDVEIGCMIGTVPSYLLASVSSKNWSASSNSLFLSKFYGFAWKAVSADFATAMGIEFAKHPNGDVYAVSFKGVYKSTTGEYWTYCHPGSISCIAIDADSIIYVGLEDELRTSSNEGNTWDVFTFTQKPFEIEYIFVDQSESVYIETSNVLQSFLYKKTRGTSVWSLIGEMNGKSGGAYGYQPQVNSKGDIFYLDSSDLYKIDRTITPVKEEFSILPPQYELHQNYPNPFNPTTTINYSILQTSFVTLKVYDILGNEVETLVNEHKPTGYYSVTFDASKLSSGLYLYHIQAGTFSMTKKMILVK